jgi:hypothetical protein
MNIPCKPWGVRTAALLCLLALAGCASRPPVPDWSLNAESAAQRAATAYLEGRQRVQALEWDKARAEVARTARTDLAARLELMRCAAQVASLDWDGCPGYQVLAADAEPAEAAYARYLAGRPQPGDVGLLPAAQQAVARALLSSSDVIAPLQAIADPQSRLVAAAVALRSGRGQPALLDLGVDAASSQGWRRPVMAWLLLQAQALEQAGDTDGARALRRRLALVEGGAAAAGVKDQ